MGKLFKPEINHPKYVYTEWDEDFVPRCEETGKIKTKEINPNYTCSLEIENAKLEEYANRMKRLAHIYEARIDELEKRNKEVRHILLEYYKVECNNYDWNW